MHITLVKQRSMQTALEKHGSVQTAFGYNGSMQAALGNHRSPHTTETHNSYQLSCADRYAKLKNINCTDSSFLVWWQACSVSDNHGTHPPLTNSFSRIFWVTVLSVLPAPAFHTIAFWCILVCRSVHCYIFLNRPCTFSSHKLYRLKCLFFFYSKYVK